jgi:hypothetical protein
MFVFLFLESQNSLTHIHDTLIQRQTRAAHNDSTAIAITVPAWDGNGMDNAYGAEVSAAVAARQISINSDTTWKEVEEGEIIQFVIGNKTFSWKFNGDVIQSK